MIRGPFFPFIWEQVTLKVIRISESGKILLVESEILGLESGIQVPLTGNPAVAAQNPAFNTMLV